MYLHVRDSGETEGKKKTSLAFTHEEAMGIKVSAPRACLLASQALG